MTSNISVSLMLALAIMSTFAITGCSAEGDSDSLAQAVDLGQINATSLRINSETDFGILAEGETIQLRAEALNAQDEVVADLTESATWLVSNPIVTISRRGVMTAGSVEGTETTEVRARFAQITTDPINVTVSNAELASIVIDDTTLEVDECQALTLVARGQYGDEAEVRPQPLAVTWSSDADATIAFFASASNGLLLTLNTGTTNVIASRGDIDSVSQAITINDSLDSVTVIPDGATSLLEGGSLNLSLEGDYGGTARNLVSVQSWVSDNSSVASVSSSGRVTAASNGSATITGSCGGQAGALQVTVNPVRRIRVVDDQGDATPSSPLVQTGSQRVIQLGVIASPSASGSGNDDFVPLRDLGDITWSVDINSFSVNNDGELIVPAVFNTDQSQLRITAELTDDVDDEIVFDLRLN